MYRTWFKTYHLNTIKILIELRNYYCTVRPTKLNVLFLSFGKHNDYKYLVFPSAVMYNIYCGIRGLKHNIQS